MQVTGYRTLPTTRRASDGFGRVRAGWQEAPFAQDLGSRGRRVPGTQLHYYVPLTTRADNHHRQPLLRCAHQGNDTVGGLGHMQRAECHYKLGVMHDKQQGCGSLCSGERAVEWWAMAAAQGHAGAYHQLAEFYQKRGSLSPGEKRRGGGKLWEYWELAAEYFKNSSDLGHAVATERLGFVYENGLGVDMSYAEARRLFAKAHYELGGTEITMKSLTRITGLIVARAPALDHRRSDQRVVIDIGAEAVVNTPLYIEPKSRGLDGARGMVVDFGYMEYTTNAEVRWWLGSILACYLLARACRRSKYTPQ